MSASIVFIDERVTDYQTLIDGLEPDTEYFLIEEDADGVEQIAAYMQGRDGIDALHIISHGSQGTLYLGNAVLDSENLVSYQAQLSAIGFSLTDTGDILLYGCNIAEGDIGIQFIDTLAHMTGADVAGSTDLTGSEAQGGNWILERIVGSVSTTTIVGDSSSFGPLVATSISNGFRLPVGNGTQITEANDGDGYYVFPGQNFNDLVVSHAAVDG
ncbi:MAG: DUF4347 domain-containing protein [Rhodocyclales bacterium]|nr:DUF4347 domain-containing protein [Rhodocyclales bacterium]